MTQAVSAIMIMFGLPVLCLTAIIIAALLAHGKRSRRADDPEETRMIQEMHRGIEKLEQRIESLETLVLDKERKEQS